MKTLEQLKQERQNLDVKIRDIEYKELVEKSIPELRKCIGNCYKYDNSYGGGTKKWPLYKKIVSIDEKTMTFNTISFEHTSMDIVEIKHDQSFNYSGINSFENWRSGYIKISNAEFDKAKKSIIKIVNRLLS